MATFDEGDNSQQRKHVRHKIFLCHSGANKSFVEHLWDHLTRVNYYPFFDNIEESLPKGEKFAKIIFEAAKQCQLAIVVLSEEFFMSTWPMMELSTFVDAQQSSNPNLKILPLFYKISVGDFKDNARQSTWIKAWERVAATKPEGRIDILKWKAALKVLAAENGCEFRPGQSEVGYIADVVRSVMHLVPADVQYSDSFIQGKSQMCEDVEKMFQSSRPSAHAGCKIVGLYGMGGIGKTTLCKAMCNYYFKEFDGRVCLVEMGKKTLTQLELQKEVLHTLTDASDELVRRITDLDKGKYIYGDRIMRQSVFLALDNVRDVPESIFDEAITYLDASFHPRSKILVTSRSADILHKLGINTCHEMPELEDWTYKKKQIRIESLYGSYNWDHTWKLPRPSQGVVSFDVQGSGDVHIAFSTKYEMWDPMYEIVIGARNNTTSLVRRNAHGEILHEVPRGLAYRGLGVNHLWLSIDASTHLIQIGRGLPYEDVFCIYKGLQFISDIQYISFTSWDRPFTISNVTIATTANNTGITLDGPFHEFWRSICNIHHIFAENKGHMMIDSANGKYNWSHYWRLPKPGQGIISFAAEGDHNVHMAISPECKTMNPMYEIVVGGWSNQFSIIRRNSQGEIYFSTPSGLKYPGSGNELWVSIDSNTHVIQVGRGSPGEDVFCMYRDSQFVSQAQYICFTTWNKPIVYSKVIVTTLPNNVELTLNRPLGWLRKSLVHVDQLLEEGKEYIKVDQADGIYKWNHYWRLPRPGQGMISFVAEGHNDVHIAISMRSETIESLMYEVVVGGWKNTSSLIRRSPQGPTECSTSTGLRYPGGMNKLWISLDVSTQWLRVGRGLPGDDVIFMYKDCDFIGDSQFITFTAWDTPITFSDVVVTFID